MVRPAPLVVRAQEAVGRVLGAGGIAVDATAGNGHDTLFLARSVGPGGRVYAVDLQERAIAATRARLAEAGLEDRVRLCTADHETLAERVDPDDRGRVAAVMFNLGYLPGGDHTLITRPPTTLAALEAGRALLAPGGRMTILAYTGHPGGADEAAAVRAWATGSTPERNRIEYGRGERAPQLLVVERP